MNDKNESLNANESAAPVVPHPALGSTPHPVPHPYDFPAFPFIIAIVVTLAALCGTGCAHAGTRVGYSREPIQKTWSECRALALNSSQRLACDQAAWLECRAAAHPLTCAEGN